MKTIGAYLLDARQRKGIDLVTLSEKTKIRKDYLEAMEQNKFERLPSAAFVKGFIRNYAMAVGVDPEKALAIFRRDFDHNEAGKVVPRGLSHPITTRSTFWNPRTTTAVIAVFFFLLIGGYFANQIRTLMGAPALSVNQPDEEALITTNTFTVAGTTHTDALVLVNNQPVGVNQEGEFETTINLSDGVHTIIIEAEDREGKRRQVTRTVTVQPE